MDIREITLERITEGSQCGTLAFRDGDRCGHLLFVIQWPRNHRVTVEFVPGLGAYQADISVQQDQLATAVMHTVFEQVSRKTLFS